jgi:hypothetical protein
MTPAIARATDFRFRVMFIVFKSPLGHALLKGRNLSTQEQTAVRKIDLNPYISSHLRQCPTDALTIFLAILARILLTHLKCLGSAFHPIGTGSPVRT